MTVRVEISLTAGGIGREEVLGWAAVAIDVLRASSTIVTALANGAREIIPLASSTEALAARSGEDLLGGEHGGLPIPGFDLGNSPLEYLQPVVEARKVLLVTTNGTGTILRIAGANPVLVGCLLNAQAIARALAGCHGVVLACAGTMGRFSLEDFVAAGAITHFMEEEGAAVAGDHAQAAKAVFQHYRNHLAQVLEQTGNGQHLNQLGFRRDLEYCARLNFLETVPVYSGHSIIVG